VAEGNNARQAIKILQFCGVSKRPLTVDKLREVLSVEPGEKRLPNDMECVLLGCGCLTFVDEEENCQDLGPGEAAGPYSSVKSPQ
jgi:hypothetical protein